MTHLNLSPVRPSDEPLPDMLRETGGASAEFAHAAL